MEKELKDIDFNKGTLLLVDKPFKWTSFHLVNRLKRHIKAKTGHGGTLDPLATGLMIIATGKFTKKLTELTNLSKEYTGTFYLGAVTPSFDLETDPTDFKLLSDLSETEIKAAADSFLGVQEQFPPAFSAVKVDGVRAYKLARKGEQPDIKSKSIEIFEFEITKVDLPKVDFRVVCSKGTYIRTLANDFGQKLGVGAYLSELRRTKIGDYHIEDAWQADKLIAILKENAMSTKEEEIK